jgi:spore maturation protein CgeB
MFIFLSHIGPTPYNASIWQGMARGFHHLGHRVQVVGCQEVPDPASLPEKPALFFAVHGRCVPPEKVQALRAAGVVTAVFLLDEPYEVDFSLTWSPHYHHVFTCDRATVPVHGQFTHAVHLPLGYDDTVFRPDGPAIPSEILLLGTPYNTREALLRPLIGHFGSRMTFVGPQWKTLTTQGTHHDQFVPPEGCAQFYRGAKIVLNIHRDSVWSHFGDLNKAGIAATHLNPRFWEAAACGSLQVCDTRGDLGVYAPRTPAYDTADQLATKLDYFLGNERARREQAARLLKAMQRQSYTDRARQVLAVCGLADG